MKHLTPCPRPSAKRGRRRLDVPCSTPVGQGRKPPTRLNRSAQETCHCPGVVCGTSEPVKNPGVCALPTYHLNDLAKHQNERGGEKE